MSTMPVTYFTPLHGGNVVITGVNYAGMAVGYEITGAGVKYPQIYTMTMGNPVGTTTDLASVSSPGAAWLETAMAINDHGVITGQGMPNTAPYGGDEIGYTVSMATP